MNRLTLIFHLVLKCLADKIVEVFLAILMTALVFCGAIIDSKLDMIAGGVFLGAILGDIGKTVIDRMDEEEDDDEGKFIW